MSAVARLQTAWNSTFFVVSQLTEANSDAVRAGILLRLPDDVIAAKAEQMQDACREAGFGLGADFISIRLAHQCLMRDRWGNLPKPSVDQLEFRRRGMVAISESDR